MLAGISPTRNGKPYGEAEKWAEQDHILGARKCRAWSNETARARLSQHVAQLLASSPVVGHPTFVELEVDEALIRKLQRPRAEIETPCRVARARTEPSHRLSMRAERVQTEVLGGLVFGAAMEAAGTTLRLACSKGREVVGDSVADHVAVVDLRSDASPISRGSCAGLSRRSIGRFRPSSGERHENHSTTPAGVSEKRNWLTIRAIAPDPPEIVPFRGRGLGGGEPPLELARAHTDQLCNLSLRRFGRRYQPGDDFLAGSIVGDRLILCDRREGLGKRVERHPQPEAGIGQVRLHQRDLRAERRPQDDFDVIGIHVDPNSLVANQRRRSARLPCS